MKKYLIYFFIYSLILLNLKKYNMANKTISFSSRPEIVVQERMSRTMHCIDCEKEIYIGKAKHVLLHEGEHDRTQLFKRGALGKDFKLGYSPQLISNLIFKEFKNGEIKVYFKHMCGVEGCGYTIKGRTPEGKYAVEHKKIHSKEFSLDEFLKLCKDKEPKRYIEILK